MCAFYKWENSSVPNPAYMANTTDNLERNHWRLLCMSVYSLAPFTPGIEMRFFNCSQRVLDHIHLLLVLICVSTVHIGDPKIVWWRSSTEHAFLAAGYMSHPLLIHKPPKQKQQDNGWACRELHGHRQQQAVMCINHYSGAVPVPIINMHASSCRQNSCITPMKSCCYMDPCLLFPDRITVHPQNVSGVFTPVLSCGLVLSNPITKKHILRPGKGRSYCCKEYFE